MFIQMGVVTDRVVIGNRKKVETQRAGLCRQLGESALGIAVLSVALQVAAQPKRGWPRSGGSRSMMKRRRGSWRHLVHAQVGLDLDLKVGAVFPDAIESQNDLITPSGQWAREITGGGCRWG